VQIAQSMRAEGAIKIVVVTDEPQKYAHTDGLPEGTTIEHRDGLDRIQQEFRTIKGTTVIIYDQTCATEKRRRRKRGTMVDPARRVVINELVCEGCGDCGVQSNCMSVEPLETEFGRKRQINQSTCNKDFSCVKGFCPSFVTVEGGSLKKATSPRLTLQNDWPALDRPVVADIQAVPGAVWGIVVAGVGGTGVITIGQLLGVAAHLEGKGIVTQDAGGLAQKGGATWSHVLIGASQEHIRTTRVSMASADLIIGCDPIVVAGKETLLRMRNGRTHVALNANSAPTAAFVKNANWVNPGDQCIVDISQAVGDQNLGVFNADAIATQFMGDSIFTNPIMLGYAWQKGWIPLRLESLMRAMELNAVAIDKNKLAFEWGRRAAQDPEAVQRALAPAQVVTFSPRSQQSLDDIVARRVSFLTDYQNAAYARRYSDTVKAVQQSESALGLPGTPLAEAVARYLFKVMAYKDEYEVARLHRDAGFKNRLSSMFEGDFKLHYHLAPPVLGNETSAGLVQKRSFGPWMGVVFAALAPLKVLRGGIFDVFGYTSERKAERALAHDYQAAILAILPALSATNREAALTFARLPEQVRGFGHVKARNLAAVQQQWKQLLAQIA
jgi:indolepyruvate ferredoxin oxidoreductase